MNSAHILKSSVLLTGLTILTMLASFLVQLVIAYLFGAGWEVDVYFVSSAVPIFIMTILNDAIGLTIIPLLNEYKDKGDEMKIKQLKVTILLITLLCSISLTSLYIIGSKWIIQAIAPPDLSEKQFLLALDISALLMLAAGFSICSSVLLYFYYFEGRFVLPSCIHFIPPLSIIVFGFFLSDRIGIKSLAFGSLIGGMLQCIVLMPIIFNLRGVALVLNYGVQKIYKNILLTILSLLPLPLVPIIDRYFASSLPEGTISYLGYSWALALAAASIISRGVLITLFPYLSEKFYSDSNKLPGKIQEMVEFFFFISIPLVLIMIFVREPLVRFLFMRGKFTAVDAANVSSILFWHMISVIGIVLFSAINRVNYALNKFRNSTSAGFLQIILYISISAILVKYFSFKGIAMANSLAWAFSAIFLMTLLCNKGIIKDISSMFNSLLKVVYSGIIMFLFLKLGIYVKSENQYTLLLFFIVGGLAIYIFSVLYIFKVPIIRKIFKYRGAS